MLNRRLIIIKETHPTNKEQCQETIEKIIYISHTRSGFAFSVGIVSRFKHQPHVQHIDGILRIIRYLKGSIRRCILFFQHLLMHIEKEIKMGESPPMNTLPQWKKTLEEKGEKNKKVTAVSSVEDDFMGFAKEIVEVLSLQKL